MGGGACWGGVGSGVGSENSMKVRSMNEVFSTAGSGMMMEILPHFRAPAKSAAVRRATKIQMKGWLLREFILFVVGEADDSTFTCDFDHGKEDSDMGGFVGADDEGVDVGVFDGIAELVAEFFFGCLLAFEEDEVVGGDEEGEVGFVRVGGGGLHGAGGEFDAAVGLDELAAHHEEDEELENDVDERGHIDPGVNTAFSGDEHF